MMCFISKSSSLVCFVFLAFFLTGAVSMTVECPSLQINQTKNLSEKEQPGFVFFNTSGTTGSVTFNILQWNNPIKWSYFILEANSLFTTLYLNKTLDLEELHELGLSDNIIVTETICQNGAQKTTYQMLIIIKPVNEFPPHFIGEPFNTSIREDALVGEIVYSMKGRVDDADFDTQPNKISRIRIHPYEEPTVDGEDYFHISGDVRDGDIALTREVDYESLVLSGHTYFMLNVSAEDTGNLMSTTTVNISVLNVDDLGPAFTLQGCDNVHTVTCSGYSASIDNTYTGLIDIKPIAIEAIDMDKLGAVIHYTISLVSPPKYRNYVSIDANTGAIRVTSPLQDADTTVFIYLQATEDTPKRNSSTAYVALTVRRSDATTNPPGGSTLVGQSTNQASVSWVVVGPVLGACFILLIIVAIVTFCVSKRFRTPIFPGGSDAEDKISHDEIQSRTTSTWPPSRTNSKQELIRNEYLNPVSELKTHKNTQLPPVSHQEKSEPRRPKRKKKKVPTATLR